MVKRLALCVACCVGVLGLASCESFPGDPMAISVRDGDLVVVVCEATRAEAILVQERRGSEWSTLWESQSAFDVGPAIELRGFNFESHEPAELEPGDEIFVGLKLGGTDRDAAFVLPERGLQEDQWLNEVGDVKDHPCSF